MALLHCYIPVPSSFPSTQLDSPSTSSRLPLFDSSHPSFLMGGRGLVRVVVVTVVLVVDGLYVSSISCTHFQWAVRIVDGRTRRRRTVCVIAGRFVFSMGCTHGCWAVPVVDGGYAMRAAFGLETSGQNPTCWGCARDVGLSPSSSSSSYRFPPTSVSSSSYPLLVLFPSLFYCFPPPCRIPLLLVVSSSSLSYPPPPCRRWPLHTVVG
jgi:hypothetical protein